MANGKWQMANGNDEMTNDIGSDGLDPSVRTGSRLPRKYCTSYNGL
jgi:hypothetical protein